VCGLDFSRRFFTGQGKLVKPADGAPAAGAVYGNPTWLFLFHFASS
jgi:hypothetical protein